MGVEHDRELDRRFGIRLKERRESMGVTQEVLAEEASLSRTSVVNIERGRQGVSLGTLYRLARALNCPPSALLPDLQPAPKLQVLIGHASTQDAEILAAIQQRANEQSSK